MKNKFAFLIAIILLSQMMISKLQAQKREFANIKRYEEANSDLAPPSRNENRVVFMGNSITDSWPEEFFQGKPYINRGISGQTTPQMLIRFRPDVIDLKPKVVVILAGTNDIAGNTGPATLDMITDNIKSMCELAAYNNIRVVLCSVLPANIYPWSEGIEPADIIIELNKRLKKYARKNNYIYLDYYTPMADEDKGLKAAYANDAVHPNNEGYKLMESLVEEAISKALSE